MLVRRARNDEVLAWLTQSERWTAFAAAAQRVRADRLPLALDEVRAAVDAAPATATELAALVRDWHARIAALEAAVAQLTGATDREGWVAWLAEAKPEGVQAFAAQLAAHGFGGLHPAATVADLQAACSLDRLRDQVAAGLASEEGRTRWLATFRTKETLDEKLQCSSALYLWNCASRVGSRPDFRELRCVSVPNCTEIFESANTFQRAPLLPFRTAFPTQSPSGSTISMATARSRRPS
jgi:hypothetical protein